METDQTDLSAKWSICNCLQDWGLYLLWHDLQDTMGVYYIVDMSVRDVNNLWKGYRCTFMIC